MSSNNNKKEKKKQKPIHHTNSFRSNFQNPWPSAQVPTWGELLKVSFPLSWYPSHSLSPDDVPKVKVVEPDWGTDEYQALESGSADCVIGTWLGHASALAEFKNTSPSEKSTYVLFDPIFSFRAGPTQYTGPSRFNKIPCNVSDLPGCDAVFVSHNHYDHLDLSTVQKIQQHFPKVKWFVPLRNKAWFKESGIDEKSVFELDWWESHFGFDSIEPANDDAKIETTSKYKITCVPAQHNSGRKGWDGGTTLWCGWVIEKFLGKDRVASVYHAGDTGYRRIDKSSDVCPAFKQISEKFSGFDLSFIPIWRGGSLGFFSYAGLRLHHNHIPSAFHCSPEDAVAIHEDVKSRNTVAIHFGTFVGSDKESEESVVEFVKACKHTGIALLRDEGEADHGRAGILNIGESVVIQPTNSFEAVPNP